MVCFFHEKACKGTAFFLYTQLNRLFFAFFIQIFLIFALKRYIFGVFLSNEVYWAVHFVSKTRWILTTESHGTTDN